MQYLYAGSERNKVPFYGETGLNAGIMHMDLEKMRDIQDGWTNANLAILDKYKARYVFWIIVICGVDREGNL